MVAVIPALLWWSVAASAQTVPATPKKWSTHIEGAGNSASVGIEEAAKKPPKVLEVTYVVLSPQRQFRSTDGKSLSGKLIAFEQTVTERAGNTPASDDPAKPTPPPAPPSVGKPTVIKDGKVRLLVNSKPFELPLARLSEDDRKFVEGIRAKIDGTPPAAAPAENPESR